MSATKSKGRALELVPLTVETRGEVIASNVDEFREMVRTALEAINREPATDEEFGQAEQDVKALKEAETAVKEAKDKALADAEQLNALFQSLDDTSEDIRQARLELDKVVKAKKAEVRETLIADAAEEIDLDLLAGEKLSLFRDELELVVKNKRTLASMGKALDACVKIVNRRIRRSRAILDEFEEAYGREMILDRAELERKTPEQVEAELRRRFELASAEEEKRTARAEAEKAKAEAAAARDEAEEARKPAPLPEAKKVDSLPTGPSPAAEWAGFETAAMVAFKQLKEARGKLRHEENIERVNRFAGQVNAAWKEAKRGEEVSA